MKPRRIPLTAAQYQELCQIEGWQLFEIERERWHTIPGLSRLDDTFAIMGSADSNDPRLLNEINAVAGFDQLVWEANPKPGEPEGNAYHHVMQFVNHPDYPCVLHGPFSSETSLRHWFEADDLDIYWSRNDE